MKNWLSRIRHFREDQDLKEELHAHLDMLAEDHEASGLPPIEATRRAHLQLGSTQFVVEKVRDQELITMLEGYYRDFLLGVRALRKSPVFCLTAILILALGIGANTAVFTLLYGLLLRSLPVPNAHRLATIGLASTLQPRGAGSVIPYRMLQEFQRHQRSFMGIAAWISERAAMKMTTEPSVSITRTS